MAKEGKGCKSVPVPKLPSASSDSSHPGPKKPSYVRHDAFHADIETYMNKAQKRTTGRWTCGLCDKTGQLQKETHCSVCGKPKGHKIDKWLQVTAQHRVEDSQPVSRMTRTRYEQLLELHFPSIVSHKFGEHHAKEKRIISQKKELSLAEPGSGEETESKKRADLLAKLAHKKPKVPLSPVKKLKVAVSEYNHSCSDEVYRKCYNGADLADICEMQERGVDLSLPCYSHVVSGEHVSFTPMYYAIVRNHEGTLRALVAEGVDPMRACCTDGRTPAFVVAETGNLPMLKVLQSIGVDFSAPCMLEAVVKDRDSRKKTRTAGALEHEAMEAMGRTKCCPKVGLKLEGNYKGRGRWYQALVLRRRADGRWSIKYSDTGETEAVDPPMLRTLGLGKAMRQLEQIKETLGMKSWWKKQYTPAFVAVHYDQMPVLRALSDTGIDFSEPCSQNPPRLPAYFAAEHDRRHTLDIMANLGDDFSRALATRLNAIDDAVRPALYDITLKGGQNEVVYDAHSSHVREPQLGAEEMELLTEDEIQKLTEAPPHYALGDSVELDYKERGYWLPGRVVKCKLLPPPQIPIETRLEALADVEAELSAQYAWNRKDRLFSQKKKDRDNRRKQRGHDERAESSDEGRAEVITIHE
jgi:hypothetical protein